MGIKSDHGIFVLDGQLREAEELASLSANSFPAIPVCPGTHINWMSVPDSVKEYRICLMVTMSGERCDLKILEERACRQNKESVVMRNLFGGKCDIVLSASIIASVI